MFTEPGVFLLVFYFHIVFLVLFFSEILPFIPILLRGSDNVGQGTTRGGSCGDATSCTLLHL